MKSGRLMAAGVRPKRRNGAWGGKRPAEGTRQKSQRSGADGRQFDAVMVGISSYPKFKKQESGRRGGVQVPPEKEARLQGGHTPSSNKCKGTSPDREERKKSKKDKVSKKWPVRAGGAGGL